MKTRLKQGLLVSLIAALGAAAASVRCSTAETPQTAPAKPIAVSGPSASSIPTPHSTPRARRPFEGHRPIAAPDKRSPAELTTAACTRSDGSWACSTITRPRLGASKSSTNTAFSVPHWYYDPQQTLACASDFNNGTSHTCGGAGDGPLVHYAETVRRWGTTEPALTADTTYLTWISPQTDNTDPIDLKPRFHGNTDGNYQAVVIGPDRLGGAAAPLIGTCQLTQTNSKNRATRTLTGSFPTCVTDINEIVVNSTHPSVAWSYINQARDYCTGANGCVRGTDGGLGPWLFSQPMLPLPGDFTETQYGEADVWADGDTISVYQPLNLYIEELGSINYGQVSLYHTKAFTAAPLQQGFSVLTISGFVTAMESRIAVWTAVKDGAFTMDNCDSIESAPHSFIDYGSIHTYTTANAFYSPFWLSAGILSRESVVTGYAVDDAIFDYTHYGGFGFFQGELGAVYLDQGVMFAQGPTDITYGVNSDGSGGIVWGLGTIQAGGDVSYTDDTSPSSATPAQDMINLRGWNQHPLAISAHCDVPDCNNVGAISWQVCTADPTQDAGAVPMYCGRALTPQMLDTSIADGGLSGRGFLPGEFGFAHRHGPQ